ncbi:universal stress protein [Salinarchaeum laminariae]|uniref:universal stress protein n=1 Tax=Salinarchaeum laminariae TaxID=869888 RepID=UPI0020BF6645|nr:universal stress protein [Salinarchaeum laminariae]
MYRVLVPIDTDESRATAQADHVADLPDAAESVSATILFVFDETTGDVPEEHKRFNTATRVGAVRRATERLEEAGVEIEIRDDSGDPSKRIVSAAEEGDFESIVVGGRERSAVGKAVFGSVALDVIRETSLPVVVTGSREE